MTQWAHHHDTYAEGFHRPVRPAEGTRLDQILAELKARPKPSLSGSETERNVTPLNTPFRTEFQTLQASIDQLADKMEPHRLTEALDALSAKVSALHADRSLGESELRLLRSIRRSLDDLIYHMNVPSRSEAQAVPAPPRPEPVLPRQETPPPVFGRRTQAPMAAFPRAIDHPQIEPQQPRQTGFERPIWRGSRLVSRYPMASVAAAALFALVLAQGVTHLSPRLGDMTGSIRPSTPTHPASGTEPAPSPQSAHRLDGSAALPPLPQQSVAAAPAPPPSLPVVAAAPVVTAAPRAPEEISGFNAYAAGIRLADGPARDYRGAVQMFEKAGDLPAAQFRLALLYERGQGAAKNPTLARSLYQKAAERGHVRAMHNLGVLYADGVDGKPDYAMAAEWFRRAAEYGLKDSQFNLATLTARGLGTEKRPATAYMWFALAAIQGDADAGRQRDDIGKTLDANALRTAKANVDAFRPKPVDPVINQMAPQ